MIIVLNKYILLPLLIFSHLGVSSPITTTGSDQKQNEYRVGSLPGLDKLEEIPIMYSGHLEIDSSSDTNYYFWKFSKPNQTNNRTVFWLNGGPGCSSMDGALMEVGPLRINDRIEVEYNNGSWYELGDLVFVDQPGGTGFSYTDSYDKELSEVADNFITFLDKFFDLFPNDLTNELYIAGESYAGQYIPYIANALHKLENSTYDLKGLMIGNGWISPNEQSLSYIPFMMNAELIHKDDQFFSDLLTRQEKCQNAISHGTHKAIRECDSILDHILGYTRDQSAGEFSQCINMYDYRLKDSYPSCGMNWPPLLPNVKKFLRDESIMKALNLKKMRQWNECDSAVSRNLKALHSKEAIEFLPDLLQHYKIILFNGDKDIICNSLGTEMMISNLDWAGSRGFSSDIETINWYYDSLAAGNIKTENNLTFINVYNASHMVPFDNSLVSRGIMDIMLDNIEPFGDGIATPVYIKSVDGNGTTSTPGHQGKPEYNGHFSSHSIGFYIFEVLLLFLAFYVCEIIGRFIIVNAIRYFRQYYSTQRPTSILHNNNNGNRKSKKVHWIDELEENFINDNDPEHEEDDSTKKGVINNLWSKWSPYSKVPTAGNEEDIEMTGGEIANSRANEEFIIDSDED